MRTKLKKIILGLLGVLVLGGIMTVVFISFDKANEKSKDAEIAEKIESAEVVESLPYVYSDEGFERRVHEMTHQKVYAESKWGAFEMKEENIDMLLKVLDETEMENEESYREILTTWKKGDFSNSVEVHNRIWSSNEGDIGEAERLATPEEERIYVEENFRMD